MTPNQRTGANPANVGSPTSLMKWIWLSRSMPSPERAQTTVIARMVTINGRLRMVASDERAPATMPAKLLLFWRGIALKPTSVIANQRYTPSSTCSPPPTRIGRFSRIDARPTATKIPTRAAACANCDPFKKSFPASSSPISSVIHASSAPSERVAPMPHMTWAMRSEEHTSELQSHVNLVCRLLLEKKKKKKTKLILLKKNTFEI